MISFWDMVVFLFWGLGMEVSIPVSIWNPLKIKPPKSGQLSAKLYEAHRCLKIATWERDEAPKQCDISHTLHVLKPPTLRDHHRSYDVWWGRENNQVCQLNRFRGLGSLWEVEFCHFPIFHAVSYTTGLSYVNVINNLSCAMPAYCCAWNYKIAQRHMLFI